MNITCPFTVLPFITSTLVPRMLTLVPSASAPINLWVHIPDFSFHDIIEFKTDGINLNVMWNNFAVSAM